MDPKKKNLLLFGVVVVLLAGAVAMAFRDSIFGNKDRTDPEIRAVVEAAAKSAEPAPVEVPKSNFHKQARPVGGR